MYSKIKEGIIMDYLKYISYFVGFVAIIGVVAFNSNSK